MNVELTEISGVSSDLATRLKKEGIRDSNMLAEALNTPEERESLASKLNESALLVYNLAKQAELLRCSKIKPADAEALVRAGVRCVEDLKVTDPDKLADYIFDNGISTDVDEEVALEWIAEALNSTGTFQADPGDLFNKALELATSNNVGLKHSSMYGSDLSEIITDLGVGIAQAQRNLDMVSLEMQREILKDPELAAMGFNATWYAIPETSFTLKMEYTYSETGDRHFSVVPMNATYNNAFRTDRAEESTLSLRFVPVPAPSGLTDRITVPDFVGMTQEEAAATAEELGLKVSFAVGKGVCTASQSSMVTRQSIKAGTLVMGSELVRLTYVDSESRLLVQQLVNTLNNRLQWMRKRIAELELKFPDEQNPNSTGNIDPELRELFQLKYGGNPNPPKVMLYDDGYSIGGAILESELSEKSETESSGADKAADTETKKAESTKKSGKQSSSQKSTKSKKKGKG